MRSLRLALVTRRFWPLPGGIENTLTRVCHELVRRGHQVTAYVPRTQGEWPATTDRHGVRIRRLEPSGGRWWSEARYLRRLSAAVFGTAETRPEVVWTLGLKGDAYAMLGAAAAYGVPVVLQPERPGLSGDCHWQLEAPCGARIKRRCYAAAGYVALTPLVERELIAAGYPRPRIRHVPLGVPIREASTPQARAEARRSLALADPALAIDEPSRLILCAGRFRLARGLELMLEAFRRCAARRPESYLWFVGEGPDAAYLRERVFELGLARRVRLTGAFDDVEDVFRAADVAVFPPPEDGPAVGLLEAASFGLPIVASDVLTHRTWLSDGCEARLYPKQDAEALAAALEATFDDPRAAALGAAARARVAAEHSLAHMVDAYERLFDDCRVRTAPESPR